MYLPSIQVGQAAKVTVQERPNLSFPGKVTRTSSSLDAASRTLLTEVQVVLDATRFCADHAYGFLRDEKVPHGNLAMKVKAGRIRREAHGVIGIISPWNYPFSIPATETLAALVAGNAVVLKPSELTPLIALELASLLYAAGVPKDVFQVIVGEGAAGAALLRSPIDKLVFTGSVATGKRIAAAAAERLLPARHRRAPGAVRVQSRHACRRWIQAIPSVRFLHAADATAA